MHRTPIVASRTRGTRLKLAQAIIGTALASAAFAMTAGQAGATIISGGTTAPVTVGTTSHDNVSQPGGVAVSNGGCASNGYVNVSTTGCASGGTVGASGTGTSTSGVGVSGTGTSTGPWGSVSGTDNATGGPVAASTFGNANAPVCTATVGVAVSVTGDATSECNTGGVAISGTGTSTVYGSGVTTAVNGTSCAWNATVGISGTGCASGGLIGVSGGSAYGNQTVGVGATGPATGGLAAVSGTTNAGGGMVGVAGGYVANGGGYVAAAPFGSAGSGIVSESCYNLNTCAGSTVPQTINGQTSNLDNTVNSYGTTVENDGHDADGIATAWSNTATSASDSGQAATNDVPGTVTPTINAADSTAAGGVTTGSTLLPGEQTAATNNPSSSIYGGYARTNASLMNSFNTLKAFRNRGYIPGDALEWGAPCISQAGNFRPECTAQSHAIRKLNAIVNGGHDYSANNQVGWEVGNNDDPCPGDVDENCEPTSGPSFRVDIMEGPMNSNTGSIPGDYGLFEVKRWSLEDSYGTIAAINAKLRRYEGLLDGYGLAHHRSRSLVDASSQFGTNVGWATCYGEGTNNYYCAWAPRIDDGVDYFNGYVPQYSLDGVVLFARWEQTPQKVRARAVVGDDEWKMVQPAPTPSPIVQIVDDLVHAP